MYGALLFRVACMHTCLDGTGVGGHMHASNVKLYDAASTWNMISCT
jgi:hypothetical protein